MGSLAEAALSPHHQSPGPRCTARWCNAGDWQAEIAHGCQFELTAASLWRMPCLTTSPTSQDAVPNHERVSRISLAALSAGSIEADAIQPKELACTEPTGTARGICAASCLLNANTPHLGAPNAVANATTWLRSDRDQSAARRRYLTSPTAAPSPKTKSGFIDSPVSPRARRRLATVISGSASRRIERKASSTISGVRRRNAVQR